MRRLPPEVDYQIEDERVDSKAESSCSSESRVSASIPQCTPSSIDETIQQKDTTVEIPVKHRRKKRSNDAPAPIPVKIPKPVGEVGRPGRGGYNLEVALGWQKEKFTRVKVGRASSVKSLILVTQWQCSQNVIKQLVVEDLTCDLPFSKQAMVKIQYIRDEALKKLPMLEDYQDLWVVDDFIRCQLRYQHSILRKEKEKLKLAKGALAKKASGSSQDTL
ncbi:hypothetical protein BT96DRAFT_1010027 [Gymnopus androsaceus JB14]|uniref:Uncharacterized protein n=1 Tax=Gymnopus androsaceus JB14 TaxID=1447944 RepID=A0A6A4GBC9_9AGAR|nr:hypothetical protein BT96DRAFT_1010027 [Gymnopus androsaceus JB14]